MGIADDVLGGDHVGAPDQRRYGAGDALGSPDAWAGLATTWQDGHCDAGDAHAGDAPAGLRLPGLAHILAHKLAGIR